MAKTGKKHRKQAVYHNRYYSTQTPDERERSLMPGTKEYQKKQAERLSKAFNSNRPAEQTNSDQKQEELDDQIEQQVVSANTEPSEPEMQEEIPDMAHDVAVRKFRRQRGKERRIAEVQSIVKGATGTKIPEDTALHKPGDGNSIRKAVNDDGISEKQFVNKVVRDYEGDLKKVCNMDTNGDGKVDEEDITPGMRKMMKYM